MGRFFRLVGSASLVIAPLGTLAAQGTSPFTIAAPGFSAYAGSSVPLRLIITDTAKVHDLAIRVPSWESSDPAKAWVTPGGVVVLLEPGHVTMRARMGNYVAERDLDIRKPEVRHLLLSVKGSASAGERVKIVAVATDQDEQVVTGARPTFAVVGDGGAIDGDGQFVSRVPGSFLVLAELGGVTATQRIDVASRAIEIQQQGSAAVVSFEIATPKYEPYTQTTMQLETSLSDVPNSMFAWGVSDSSVATVSPSGMLELRRPGKVRVWAATNSTRAEREIRVLANPAADVALRVDAKDVHVGDEVRVKFDAWARGGRPVEHARVMFAVAPTDAPSDGARMRDDGTFIARAPGVYTIIAALGGKSDRQTIVVRPR